MTLDVKLAVLGSMIALGVSRADAVPPPPPPTEGTASFNGIDSLSFLQGVWKGEQRDSIGGRSYPAEMRIGRFGTGDDHLLMGSILTYGKEGEGTVGHHLHVLTYDATRGGYRIYDPSFYNDNLDPSRGHDEQVSIVTRPPGSMTWTRTISGGQRQTIVVSGKRWDERVESTLDDGKKRVIETHLIKQSDNITWGEIADH